MKFVAQRHRYSYLLSIIFYLLSNRQLAELFSAPPQERGRPRAVYGRVHAERGGPGNPASTGECGPGTAGRCGHRPLRAYAGGERRADVGIGPYGRMRAERGGPGNPAPTASFRAQREIRPPFHSLSPDSRGLGRVRTKIRGAHKKPCPGGTGLFVMRFRLPYADFAYRTLISPTVR